VSSIISGVTTRILGGPCGGLGDGEF